MKKYLYYKFFMPFLISLVLGIFLIYKGNIGGSPCLYIIGLIIIFLGIYFSIKDLKKEK